MATEKMVLINLSTICKAHLQYLGITIPKKVKSVDRGWTWKQVLRSEYGISFSDSNARFIHFEKIGSKMRHKLDDKVSKFVRQYKSKIPGRIYTVRLVVSKQVRYHQLPQPTQLPQINVGQQLDRSPSTSNSQSSASSPVIVMDYEIGEEGIRKEEDFDYGQNDWEENVDPLRQDGQRAQVWDEDGEEGRPFSNPMDNSNIFCSNRGSDLRTNSDSQVDNIDESRHQTVTNFDRRRKKSKGRDPLAPPSSNRSKGLGKFRRSEVDVQDDTESVFTTDSQLDVLFESDFDRFDRFKTMMADLPNGMVMKMYEELEKMSDTTWQRWLARAPTVTGILRQSFKIA